MDRVNKCVLIVVMNEILIKWEYRTNINDFSKSIIRLDNRFSPGYDIHSTRPMFF